MSASIETVPEAPQLQAELVAKAYHGARGTTQVLSNVSLSIRRGEFVSLIGHSGCGKSTLLNLIAGLQQPSAGRMLFEGAPIAGPGPDRAMVFQHYSLLPWLSVYQNVYEALVAVRRDLPSQQKQELAQDILERVGLTAHLQKKPHQLSGGMRQRVAIARAFAVHPRMLLLDEPFGALDALTRGILQEELLRLWQGDASTETIILVTHDIDEAIYLSDRIIVMNQHASDGSIQEIIPVPLSRPRDKRELLHDPRWGEIKEQLMALLCRPASRTQAA